MLPITFEVSHDQPLHPDPEVAARMYEIRLALPEETDCKHGCKVYADPEAPTVRILAHNSNYGCRK
jgi:hypothetical protein